MQSALKNEYDRVCVCVCVCVLECGFRARGITSCTGRAICTCATRSAGGRWLTLIKIQVTLRSESLPHIWRKTAIITRHLYTFPLAILFPHWYKNIPHLGPAQAKERERESCCLFSGPKLIANVKMDPPCSWSFAQAFRPTICGVCSQPHQTHVCGILELFGELHNYIRNKPQCCAKSDTGHFIRFTCEIAW